MCKVSAVYLWPYLRRLDLQRTAMPFWERITWHEMGICIAGTMTDRCSLWHDRRSHGLYGLPMADSAVWLWGNSISYLLDDCLVSWGDQCPCLLQKSLTLGGLTPDMHATGWEEAWYKHCILMVEPAGHHTTHCASKAVCGYGRLHLN